jgi:hypothetical protein
VLPSPDIQAACCPGIVPVIFVTVAKVGRTLKAPDVNVPLCPNTFVSENVCPLPTTDGVHVNERVVGIDNVTDADVMVSPTFGGVIVGTLPRRFSLSTMDTANGDPTCAFPVDVDVIVVWAA